METVIINNLKMTWHREIADFSANQNLINELLEFVNNKYSESYRHYHNHFHIGKMLRVLFEMKWKQREGVDTKVIITAICLHDVIYDAWSRFNEENSADFAKMLVSIIAPNANAINLDIQKCILSTKHKEAFSAKDISIEEKMIRDLDLYDFIEINTPAARFKQFQQLRAEYFWLSELEFLNGRIEFLENLLKRHKIFLMDDFIKYESEARDNITKYIIELKTCLKEK
jgi:predicted metal-dependent HD superfamily phosphohydrolase